MNDDTILRIKNLSISFKMYDKGLLHKELKVINNLNLSLRQGEILAVAGASGSGKSLLAHGILGILPDNAQVAGEISYLGTPLTEKRIKELRGNDIAFVPQSVEFLNPLMRVGQQVASDRAAVGKVFARYQLDQRVGELFPFQLSGGMMRRVLCATAVVGAAKLIIADEPTPGMSQELAEMAMKHFRDLADAGAAVLLITHDLEMALDYADRIAVLYAGTAVETAYAADFTCEEKLRHPYTKALWRAMPKNGFRPTLGIQPYAGSLREGCMFAPRCEARTEQCVCGIIEPQVLRGGEVCCLNAC